MPLPPEPQAGKAKHCLSPVPCPNCIQTTVLLQPRKTSVPPAQEPRSPRRRSSRLQPRPHLRAGP